MAVPLPLPANTHQADSPADSLESPGGLAAGWALLQEAGDALADMAQLGRDSAPLAPRAFGMRVAAAGPARLALAERAIDDCAAALHYGLTAMCDAVGQGRDVTAAALTLWREFDRARAAMQALTAPPQ